jgi:hypothetical protein
MISWRKTRLYRDSTECGERHPDAIALAMSAYAAGVRDGQAQQAVASNTVAVHLCGEVVERRTRYAQGTSHPADGYRAEGARECLDALRGES